MSHTPYEFFGDDPNFKTKLITFTVLVGGFFGFLNETLLNVALTAIMAEMHIGKTQVEWLTIGFLLVMGALTPISANIVQRFSTRRMLMMVLGTFFIGTIVCALAPSFGVLLLGRIIQAAATAFMMPVIFNTILLIYNPNRRGMVMGLIGTIFMAAPAIGPTLSGIISGHFGWRYLFWLTTPFTLMSLLLVWKYLNVNMQTITRPKIDILSVLYSFFGLGGLVYTIATFTHFPFWQALLMLLGAVVVIALFVRRQFALSEPLLDLRIFRHKQFAIGAVLFSLTGAVFIGSELVMPMYAQQVVLMSSTTAGLILLPASLSNAVLSPVAGRMLDKYGPRAVILPGTLIMTFAYAFMYLHFDLHTTAAWQSLMFALIAAGMAMVAMPAETNGLNALKKNLYPHGSATVSTLQPIAGAIGTAVFVGIISVQEQSISGGADALQSREAMMSGVSLTYLLATLLGLLTVVAAFKTRKSAGKHHGDV